jgi:hypothetical protein
MGRTVQIIRKAPHVVALGVAIALVGSLGVAGAATGDRFILGQNNTESTPSVLKNTNGTPLSLVAPKGKAPLAVNRSVKVNNLNADKLDGRTSTYFQKKLTRLVWHNLTLLNGWTNYQGTDRPPAFAVDAQGVVHFRGSLDGDGTSNSQFATLPAGLRPVATVYLAADQCEAATGRIYIIPNGGVFVQDDPAGITCSFTSLDGITYVP